MKTATQSELDYQRIMDAAGVLIEAVEDSNCDGRAFAIKELRTLPRSTSLRLQLSHELARAIQSGIA